MAPTYLQTNYVDQQTLNSDDDYVLPLQRLWMFDVLLCPLSATERFLSQPHQSRYPIITFSKLFALVTLVVHRAQANAVFHPSGVRK